MLFRLWGSSETDENARVRTEFLQPLIPHVQRSAQRLGTSASAILAIAALETGWGQSMLKDEHGQSSNNYFGIKATGRDTQFTRNTTTEYVNGRPQKVQAHFKSYASVADAIEGFADFLLENPRYSTAVQRAGDPERFLHELQQAGYATDPRYADKAITVMRQVEQQLSQP
jgi:flagellar protein FlgJ